VEVVVTLVLGLGELLLDELLLGAPEVGLLGLLVEVGLPVEVGLLPPLEDSDAEGDPLGVLLPLGGSAPPLGLPGSLVVAFFDAAWYAARVLPPPALITPLIPASQWPIVAQKNQIGLVSLISIVNESVGGFAPGSVPE